MVGLDLTLVFHINMDRNAAGVCVAQYEHISVELVSMRLTPPVFWPLPGTS